MTMFARAVLAFVAFLSLYVAGAVPTDRHEGAGRKLRPLNPEEMAGLVQGDMDVQVEDDGTFRSTLTDEMLWPNGIVPFIFSPDDDHQFSEDEKRNISLAMEQFHEQTCIRFVPRTDGQESYINFRKGRGGCSSNVGMMRPSEFFKRDGQYLKLSPGCFVLGTIQHEIMHALGFYHEQARWDRDDYVVIKPQYIMKGMLGQFRIFDPKRTNRRLGAPYDYGSLMHYSKNAFALYDEDETITPLKPGAKIGQREGFSDIDLWKINKLYKCPEYKKVTLAPELLTTPAKPDFIINPTRPPKSKLQFYCSFDFLVACGMRDALEADFDWELKQGRNLNHETGPDRDVSGKGYYASMDSSLKSPGEKAIIVTPYLAAPPGPACLMFYYHMYGKDMGTLKVYAKDYEGNTRVLLEKSGNQGKEWKSFVMTLSMDREFEIFFEGTLGGTENEFISPESVIAIDKFEYRPLALYPSLGCEAEPVQ